MATMSRGLLAQIEAGVLDDSVSLSTLLQKVIVLGGRAGSEKMRAWARHELNGYAKSEGPLPDYRRISAPLYVQITNRAGRNPITQQVNPSLLPDFMTESTDVQEVPFANGIGELEAFVAKGDRDGEPHRLSPAWADVLVDYLNKHGVDQFSVVASAYWEVQNASVKGLLVRVRTALAELVAELSQLTPDGQEVPTQAAADQATQFVITGERPMINITNQQTNSGANISVPNAQSAVLATDRSTAIGSQAASGENSTVVGTQIAQGPGSTIAGRDGTAAAPLQPERAGWWARLRARGLFVALFTVIGGVAGVVGAVVAVLVWLDWTPW